MDRSTALRSFIGCLIVLSAFPDPGSASSPPQDICGVCGDAFQSETRSLGIDLTVERSELTIGIDEEGTGHWIARVVVNDVAGERFERNQWILEKAVRSVYSEQHTVVDDPETLEATVDD